MLANCHFGQSEMTTIVKGSKQSSNIMLWPNYAKSGLGIVPVNVCEKTGENGMKD